MELEREFIVERPPESVWEMIDDPVGLAQRNNSEIKVTKQGEGDYQLEIPIKMGLFKPKAKCRLTFTNKQPMSSSDFAIDASMMGNSLKGDGTIAMKAEGAAKTKVKLTFKGDSSGIAGKLVNEHFAKAIERLGQPKN